MLPTTSALDKKLSKKIDTLVDRIYNAHCKNIQIDIMDIGKIFRVGRDAYLANAREQSVLRQVPIDQTELEAAVKTAVVNFVQSIRKN